MAHSILLLLYTLERGKNKRTGRKRKITKMQEKRSRKDVNLSTNFPPENFYSAKLVLDSEIRIGTRKQYV